jgi:hypothetical protein
LSESKVNAPERTRHVLDPIDRLSEIIFGLLMALSFTGTMSALIAEGENVGSVLIAAVGCNVAWGIVDGVMYVLTTAIERARRRSFFDTIRDAPLSEARGVFLANLPGDVSRLMSNAEAEEFLSRIRSAAETEYGSIVHLGDLRAGLSIFLLVTASTLPPSIPFLLIDHLPIAMRVSNGVAVVMLFLIGAKLGRQAGRSPWPMAFAMAAIGTVLVGLTIALGG